jgi:hypothetical protein
MADLTSPVRRETPEERELGRKRAQLAAIEGALGEEDLALASNRAEVFLFERRYMRAVGSRYAELDELEARLAETLAKRNPNDEMARYRAEAARKQADATSHAKREPEQPVDTAELLHFEPSDELKQLYRSGAKRIHPDLAPLGTSAEENERRTAAMASFSDAYVRGDETAMRIILAEWDARPEMVEGADVAAELVRVIRQIAQVERRLEAVRVELVVPDS